LEASPMILERAGDASFEFRVLEDEEPLMSFDELHERRMHLIAIRRDLTGFQHLHPRMDEDGRWVTPITFPNAGAWRVFADFSAGGVPATLGVDVLVAGLFDPQPLPQPSVSTGASTDRVMLERLPDARVEVLDFWCLMDRRVARTMRHAYLRLIREHPALYDEIYRLDQRSWRQVMQPGQPPPSALIELSRQVLAIVDEDADDGALPPEGESHLLDRLLFRQFRSTLPSDPSSTRAGAAVMRLALARWFWGRLARRLETRVQAFEPDVMISTVLWAAALLSKVKVRRRLTVA
jgi:hypothetical protein